RFNSSILTGGSTRLAEYPLVGGYFDVERTTEFGCAGHILATFCATVSRADSNKSAYTSSVIAALACPPPPDDPSPVAFKALSGPLRHGLPSRLVYRRHKHSGELVANQRFLLCRFRQHVVRRQPAP
uniref:hypothetical protein n=1 Tax=Mycobacterium sp. TaxID=1785 RepID=UPI003F99BBA5